MSIFVFSSKTLTNIWAGIGAGLWAVSKSDDAGIQQGKVTKSKNMKIGSFGVLYCSQTQCLTTSFIMYSQPDPEEVIYNVWPEEEGWVLPFRIHPLGTPRKQLHKDEAMKILPTLRKSGQTNFGHALPVQATTVFAPSPLQESDWEELVKKLAESANLLGSLNA
jgi:hypothetical protein